MDGVVAPEEEADEGRDDEDVEDGRGGEVVRGERGGAADGGCDTGRVGREVERRRGGRRDERRLVDVVVARVVVPRVPLPLEAAVERERRAQDL